MRSAFRFEPALPGWTVYIRATPSAGPIGTVTPARQTGSASGRPVAVNYWMARSPCGELLQRDGTTDRFPYREEAARALAELAERH